jgi:hypothetical protein
MRICCRRMSSNVSFDETVSVFLIAVSNDDVVEVVDDEVRGKDDDENVAAAVVVEAEVVVDTSDESVPGT